MSVITKREPSFKNFINEMSFEHMKTENFRSSVREIAVKTLREQYDAYPITNPTWGDIEGIRFNDERKLTIFLLKWSS